MAAISPRAADQTSPKGTRWIPGGTFAMGSDAFYPEEGPVHPVTVDGFWMDEHPVTVADFRRFVKATGHVTVAEHAPSPARHPGPDPTLLCRSRSCSANHPARSTWMTYGSGGHGC